eukprot:Rmarinus@m.2576
MPRCIWRLKHAFGTAVYDFEADSEFQISFKTGAILRIDAECQGWYKGVLLESGKQGIFPVDYVEVPKNTEHDDEAIALMNNCHSFSRRVAVLRKRAGPSCQKKMPKKETTERVSSIQQSMLDRVDQDTVSTIHEWNLMLRTYFQAKRVSEYVLLKDRCLKVLSWRTEQLFPETPEERKEELRRLTSAVIEGSRKMMGLDMIPRLDDGNPADPSNTPVMSLFDMHRGMQNRLDEEAGKELISQEHAKNKQQRRQEMRKRAESFLSKAGTGGPGSGEVQIFLDIKACIYAVREKTEVYCSLFSKTQNRFISEEYAIFLAIEGMPRNREGIGRLQTIFKDVPRMWFSQELYLVVRIVRDGRLVFDEKAKPPEDKEPICRRPYGCAVFGLSSPFVMERLIGETEYSPDNVGIFMPTTESRFATLHEDLINRTGQYQEAPRAKGVAMGIILYQGSYSQVIARRPELKTHCCTSMLAFPDVISPEDRRDDLYLQIEGGEFLQDRKTAAKNVECTMQVIRNDGVILKGCIVPGTGEFNTPMDTYRNVVIYHDNQPKWLETVKLTVPREDLPKAHLHFSFRHCSSGKKNEEAFSFGWVKVAEPNGLIVHGQTPGPYHMQIQTYKYVQKKEPAWYLQDSAASHLVPRKESFGLTLDLVSTQQTQHRRLHQVLHWKSNQIELMSVLKEFMYVPADEVVKFLTDVLNALFAILGGSRDDKEVSIAVYRALINIFNMVTDEKTSKFTNFRGELDAYIAHDFKKHPQAPMIYEVMLMRLKYYLERFDDLAEAKDVRSTLKNLKYVWRFVIASRKIHEEKGLRAADDTFRSDILDSLDRLNDLMGREFPEWVIGTQAILLKHFSSLLEDLAGIFSTQELSDIAMRFLEMVRPDKLKLNIEKLDLIRAVVMSKTFDTYDARLHMLPRVVGMLRMHLQRPQETEVYHAFEVLIAIVSTFGVDAEFDANASWLLRDILVAVSEVTPLLLRYERYAAMVAALLAVINALPADKWNAYIDDLDVPLEEMAALLRGVLQLCTVITQRDAFPQEWCMLQMFQYRMIVKSLNLIGPSMIKHFMADMFTPYKELWSILLNLMITVLNLPFLQIDRYSNVKRQFISSRQGDLREDVSFVLGAVWKSLGPYQAHFRLVQPFLQLTAAPVAKVSELAKDIYFDMLLGEHTETGGFAEVEALTIDAIDQRVAELSKAQESANSAVGGVVMGVGGTAPAPGAGPASDLTTSSKRKVDTLNHYINFFATCIATRFEKAESEQVKAKGRTFISDINKVCEYLCALERYPKETKYEDEITEAALRLMEYLRNTERWGLYYRYVDYLCDLHKSFSSFVEAAAVRLQYVSLIDWTQEMLPAIGKLPAEKAMTRKERLMRECMDLFDIGKYWERSISIVRELKTIYETMLFDYNGLAQLLLKESEMVSKIAATDRFFAEYFRVGYYGKGFPEDVEGKEFIYRGLELERLADFVSRIMSKWPAAEMLKSTEAVPDSVKEAPGQYIIITTVQPADPAEVDSLREPIPKEMPARLKKFRFHDNAKVFFFSRTYRKTKGKIANEFTDMWTANTFLVTRDSFPTIRRRSLIVDVHEHTLSPVENAIVNLEQKNEESRNLINTFSVHSDRQGDCGPLTMLLNGVVDAAVNGGVGKYQDAFLNASFARSDPANPQHAHTLRMCLKEQLQIIENGLELHKRICAADMLPLQDHLEMTFQKMKDCLKTDIAIVEGRELPPQERPDSPTLDKTSASIPPPAATVAVAAEPRQSTVSIHAPRLSVSGAPGAVQSDPASSSLPPTIPEDSNLAMDASTINVSMETAGSRQSRADRRRSSVATLAASLASLEKPTTPTARLPPAPKRPELPPPPAV